MIKKIKELGLSLISILIFQIALSIVSIKTSFNFIELKNFTNSTELSSSQLICEIIISLLLILSIILFFFKRQAGTILYSINILLSLVSSVIFTGLDFKNLLLSLVFPSLTLILIYAKRKDIFNI